MPSGYWRTAVAVAQSMLACLQTGCLPQQSPNVSNQSAIEAVLQKIEYRHQGLNQEPALLKGNFTTPSLFKIQA